MLKMFPCELHTHTIHSDGRLSLLELAGKAKDLGLECIALTDHNTISGHAQVQSVMKKTGLYIIRGMEWTTFYGHVLAMGIKSYVDWRDIGPEDIDKGIDNIHKAGGLAGIAHPFCVGSPLCTGCHFKFNVSDWKKVDYIEVWSEGFPSINPINIRAFDLWTNLLNKGYKISAVSGRDWHGDDGNENPMAATYIAVQSQNDAGSFETAALNALKEGKISVSMGPCISLSAKYGETKYFIGDNIKKSKEKDKINLAVGFNYDRKLFWTIDNNSLCISFACNKGVIKKLPVYNDSDALECSVDIDGINWLRAELYGNINGIETMVGFTNPIYFESR